MSILIRGMKMPKDRAIIEIHPAGGYACTKYGFVIGRVIELPPHGRLGDLDKMKADYLASTENGKFTVDVPLFIDETETIIPAEGGADNG